MRYYQTKGTSEMKELLRTQNVVIVGRGHKIVGGKDTGRIAIVVGVSRKLPVSELVKRQVIPKRYKGIETDVIETGPIKALRTKKYRPAPGGVSIGHKDITAGTLGMVVKRDGVRHILSNNHVLAASNHGALADPVYQPGPHDGGTEADKIGFLVDYEPIEFVGLSDCAVAGFIVKVCNWLAEKLGRKTRLEPIAPGSNFVDAAIAMPMDDSLVADEILEIGIPKGYASVDIGTPVKKSGRTTGLTHGSVTIMDAAVSVQYDGNIAVFEDQIITDMLCAGGDSGSIGVTEDNQAFGLLFAGSETVSVFNRIENVHDALGLT